MQEIFCAVDKYRNLILDAEKYIWDNPELGFKEIKTTTYLLEKFKQLGYSPICADGITGFNVIVDTGKLGATILILGELDAVVCPSHPEADKGTGAIHACGHNVQCATLLGIAAVLKEPNILEKFSGKIILSAVPAEEFLEIEYRSSLVNKGTIKYLGGKTEFLSRGYYDDVDVAFMTHTLSSDGVSFYEGAVGFISKKIIYKGVSAHAGANPYLGKNALYAATQGIIAVNGIRETFKDSDMIRVHPIITHGGDIVNTIPEKVELECQVRGKTYEAIKEANSRVNRALTGAALSVGANIEIIDMPGYAPLDESLEMQDLAKLAIKEVYPNCKIEDIGRGSGSTDTGDLSQIMPIICPYFGCAEGVGHGKDYYIKDKEFACIDNTKFQLALLSLLTANSGEKAKKIKQNYKPKFSSKEEYFKFINTLSCSGDRINYLDENNAEIKL